MHACTTTTTATASGPTLGSVQITTSGAGGSPSRMVVLAQPALMRADEDMFSWLTVQHQDESGKPSVSPSNLAISLKNSNPTAIPLTSTSFTILAGSNYARSTWYYNRPKDASPFAKSTLIPSTAIITADSTSLTSGSVITSSSELPSLSAMAFNKNDKKQSIFNATDTTRIGANASGVKRRYVTVTIRNPTGTLLVNNASMTRVPGKNQYNYKHDYTYTNAKPGQYYYIVATKDAARHSVKKSGNYYIMSVNTSSDGSWTVSRGGYYNASFTISVKGATAQKLTFYLDLPYWHAIAFAEVAGQPATFSSTKSPYSQYRRYILGFQNIASGQSLRIKLTIIIANVAGTGSRLVYCHSEWATTQRYPYSENTRIQTVSIT